MTESKKRERKSKGRLSVLDEFSDDAGEIIFSPTLPPNQLAEIEARTRLADVPHLAPESADGEPYQSVENSLGKPSSNVVQTSAKPELADEPLSFKPSSKPSSVSSSNVVQTSAKPSSEFEYDRLSPIQQRLILFLAEESQKNRSDVSTALNGLLLANRLECGLEGLRTAVKRLTKSGFIEVVEVKAGKTGWTRYRLDEQVFQTLIRNQTWFNSSSNVVQTSAKPSSKSSSEPSSSLSSSSSSDFSFKNTTTTQESEWDSISIPESLQSFGFGRSHLRQLSQSGKLTPAQVSDSIQAFAFDYESGVMKPKTGPLNFLMGVLLKKGSPYLSDAYLKACALEIAEYERKMKSANDAELLRKNLELETKKLEWIESLSEEEKNQIVPPSSFVATGSPAQIAMLKNYYEENFLTLDLPHADI